MFYGYGVDMNANGILICPVCRCGLYLSDKSYFCKGEKKHCFDVSSSGHANLCPGKSTGGDDKRAVRSRTEFLNMGYYQPISDKVCEIIGALTPDKCVVDAGCGEGYYTNNMALKTGASVYGFDLSKEAIISASKSAKRQGITNARFFVGGIYNLPVCDGGADVITNLFAPCAENEFSRILNDGGRLIVVTAGKNHLLGLKRAVYDEVYTNESRADMPRDMTLESKHTLSYFIDLEGSNAIQSLFSMTPYSYRTSERDMQKLMALDSLRTEVEVDIFVYRKENAK